jgi:hypothetical protein
LNAKFWMVLVLAAGILSPGMGAVAATTDQQTIRDMGCGMVEGSGEQRRSKVRLFLFRNGIGDAVQRAHRNRESKG